MQIRGLYQQLIIINQTSLNLNQKKMRYNYPKNRLSKEELRNIIIKKIAVIVAFISVFFFFFKIVLF